MAKAIKKEINAGIPIITEFMDKSEIHTINYFIGLMKTYIEMRDTEYPVTVENLMLVYDYYGRKKFPTVESAQAALDKRDAEIAEITARAIKEGFQFTWKTTMTERLQSEVNEMFMDRWQGKIGKGNFQMVESGRHEWKWLMEMVHKGRIKAEQDFISRIMNLTGTIETANLHWGIDGNLNGTVSGIQGIATVKTIGAGGYNIQCYHFRVLVKKYTK